MKPTCIQIQLLLCLVNAIKKCGGKNQNLIGRSSIVVNVITTVMMLHTIASAQSDSSSSSSQWVRTSASLGLSSDFYSSTSNSQQRLPGAIHRANLRATVTLFDMIELPFEAYITSNEVAFRQPFNQFGVSPRWGWAQMHAGYFSMRMSDFTFGDARILGGGIELSPGNFRFGAFYGVTREARQPSPENSSAGDYTRRAVGGKVGVGSEGDGHMHLSMMYSADDPSSIIADSNTLAAQENIVSSLSFSQNIFDKIVRVSGEVAGSVFTSDRTAPLVDSANAPILSELFTSNISTNIDFAARLALAIVPSSAWNIRFDARWVGPGFVTLGFIQMPNDVLDLTVTPAVRLFDGKLSLRGSLGQRTNNLRSTRLSATSRTIGSLSASAQFTDNIGLDAQYSNYGMRSQHRNDTIRVSNISQLLSFTPRASFVGLGGQNVLTCTYSLQNSEDQNQFTITAIKNNTQSIALVHSLAYESSLSLTTTAFYNSIENATISTQVTTLNETVGYSFFERTLSVTATAGVNIISTQGNQSQFMGRVGASYSLNDYGSFSLQLMNNNYNFDTASSTPAYSEYQGSLQYTLSF